MDGSAASTKARDDGRAPSPEDKSKTTRKGFYCLFLNRRELSAGPPQPDCRAKGAVSCVAWPHESSYMWSQKPWQWHFGLWWRRSPYPTSLMASHRLMVDMRYIIIKFNCHVIVQRNARTLKCAFIINNFVVVGMRSFLPPPTITHLSINLCWPQGLIFDWFAIDIKLLLE